MEPNEQIMEAVKKTAQDGKITCTQARRLAEEFNVPPKVIGEAADSQKIKIKACELGCF